MNSSSIVAAFGRLIEIEGGEADVLDVGGDSEAEGRASGRADPTKAKTSRTGSRKISIVSRRRVRQESAKRQGRAG